MGEDRTKREATSDDYEQDSARFGQVNSVSDLQQEKGVGPTIATHEQQRMLKPDGAGYFEVEGGRAGGLGAPLHLGAEIVADGGANVTDYQVAYNEYAQPLRSTYRTMGRIKDLSMTGAFLTPADLEKRPKLAERFKDITLDKQSDAVSQNALTTWSASQSHMATNIIRFGAGQHLLAGAMAKYSSVRKALDAKRVASVRAAKTAEIAEIDESVKTLHEILDVSFEAWSVAGELEEVFGTQGLNENAEGPEMVDPSLPAAKTTNWQYGTAADPGAENANVGTAGQGAANKIDAAASHVRTSKLVINNVKQKLASAGHFDLSIDGVLTAVVGGKHYVELKQQVIALDAKIRKLGLEQEADELTSATQALDGFKMQFRADRQQLKDDRIASRNAAQTFGQATGAGAEGITAMYAAEAFEELAAFGELAARERKDLEPMWGRAHHYLSSNAPQRFVAIGALSDARRLQENLGEVIEQRDFFATQLPQWKRTAAQWSSFFGEHAQKPLVRTDNDADKSERS